MTDRLLSMRLAVIQSLASRGRTLGRKGCAWLMTMRDLAWRLKSFRRKKTSAFRERGPAPIAALPAPAAAAAEAIPPSVARPRRRALRLIAAGLGCLIATPFALILLFRFVDPPFSAFMAVRALSGARIQHQWRPLEQISPHLVVAVVVSEDAQFCGHWGVDWSAVAQAWSHAANGGRPRGASTIPMQTVKNLFFWPGRNYFRKVVEAPLAYFMSLVWPKARVIEVYLNIVEWGPGVFGAEAAARYHFRKPAARLDGFQATAMAVSLPNPLLRRAGKPNPQVLRLIGRLRKRLAVEAGHAACVYE